MMPQRVQTMRGLNLGQGLWLARGLLTRRSRGGSTIRRRLLGAQRHRRIAPAETYVRVMAFGFCNLSDLLHKRQGFPEVSKPESSLSIEAAPPGSERAVRT
jgi:hypothetical protein